MAGQFTIEKDGIGAVYSCDKYSCYVSREGELYSVNINEDIKELYVPGGVTIFATTINNIKDCKVSRIILPSSVKRLDCGYFRYYSHRYEIEIPSFSVVFDNTEELSWNQPFVVCKDSSFRLNISCLLALKSQFPNAFSENGQGKCCFDNMWNDEYLEYRSLDEDSVISIGIWGREELIVPEICKQREDSKEKKIIACCFNCAPKRIYFPKTVQYVAFCCEGKEKNLSCHADLHRHAAGDLRGSVFAGAGGLRQQFHQALRHHLPEPGEVHRRAHCAVLHHVRHHLHEGYP